ncbi:DUF1983 domain-containing protein [Salmonella enterica]|uniref:phage tail tip fiber protein n=1 Tax=Salmonella enterica TaxID=28901 RepID=UPI0014397816|nr:DUF1983 domain-containing protein [Salmonella enterica]NKI03766.1 DUF1983 domain-containing protein [Salmonella enterica subsp. enterica serovar Infantis]
MSESKNIPHVTTTPKPFGVNVEWKWPEGQMWFSSLELQYLRDDGRLEKERIFWPMTSLMISGLKAGERLQVRLRPVAFDGSARDWRASDWIEGVSSVDAGGIVEALQVDIRSSATFAALRGDEGISPEEVRDAAAYIKRTRLAKKLRKSLEEISPFAVKDGQAFIKNAFIGDGVASANYSVKMGVDHNGTQHAAGMPLGVEEGKSQVKFLAEKFAVAAKTQNALEAALQKVIQKVVDDAFQKALRPGGMLWNKRGGY